MSDKKQLNVRLTDEDFANVELLKKHDVSLADVAPAESAVNADRVCGARVAVIATRAK